VTATAAPHAGPGGEERPPEQLLGGPWRPDAVTALTVYAAALMLIPARLVIGPQSASVTPANLVGLMLLAWWCFAKLVDVGAARGYNPVRIVTKLFVGCIFLSFAAMATRSVPSVERADAQRALVGVLSLAGAALVAMDGIQSRARLETLVKRLVLFAAIIGAIGWLQYLFALDIRPIYNLLPLRDNIALRDAGLQEGSDLRRVFSTTLHPIEFGAVLAFLFPLALHRVMTAGGPRWKTWIPAIIIAGAVPMSISRGAILGLFVGLVVLWFGWPARTRVNALRIFPVFLAVCWVIFPGLLGTIRSGFQNAQNDNSIQGRTEDYGNVGTFIRASPWLGRGYGTFAPNRYFFLDNQYLGAIIELGFVGFFGLVAFLVVSLFSARGSRLGVEDMQARSLAKSLGGSFVVALVAYFTFDALGFPMCAGVTFLLAGCAGAAWRLSQEERFGLPRAPGAVPG
jgi:polysaccharide biosynthesis protein PslJ